MGQEIEDWVKWQYYLDHVFIRRSKEQSLICNLKFCLVESVAEVLIDQISQH